MQMIFFYDPMFDSVVFFSAKGSEEQVQSVADPLSRTIYFFAEIDTELKNPFLPKPPDNGLHVFNGGYRCTLCGVYDRPDVPSEKAKMDAPCQGRYANSGKMKCWAEDKWEGNV